MKVLVYGSITVLAVVLVVIGLFALWYAKFIRDVTRNR